MAKKRGVAYIRVSTKSDAQLHSFGYIPLGGSHKGQARKILNIFIVFLLCGLWHGANWTYVLWGLYSALIQAIETVMRKPFGEFCEKCKINLNNAAVIFVRRAILFLLVVFGAFIFRSQSGGSSAKC